MKHIVLRRALLFLSTIIAFFGIRSIPPFPTCPRSLPPIYSFGQVLDAMDSYRHLGKYLTTVKTEQIDKDPIFAGLLANSPKAFIPFALISFTDTDGNLATRIHVFIENLGLHEGFAKQGVTLAEEELKNALLLHARYYFKNVFQRTPDAVSMSIGILACPREKHDTASLVCYYFVCGPKEGPAVFASRDPFILNRAIRAAAGGLFGRENSVVRPAVDVVSDLRRALVAALENSKKEGDVFFDKQQISSDPDEVGREGFFGWLDGIVTSRQPVVVSITRDTSKPRGRYYLTADTHDQRKGVMVHEKSCEAQKLLLFLGNWFAILPSKAEDPPYVCVFTMRDYPHGDLLCKLFAAIRSRLGSGIELSDLDLRLNPEEAEVVRRAYCTRHGIQQERCVIPAVGAASSADGRPSGAPAFVGRPAALDPRAEELRVSAPAADSTGAASVGSPAVSVFAGSPEQSRTRPPRVPKAQLSEAAREELGRSIAAMKKKGLRQELREEPHRRKDLETKEASEWLSILEKKSRLLERLITGLPVAETSRRKDCLREEGSEFRRLMNEYFCKRDEFANRGCVEREEAHERGSLEAKFNTAKASLALIKFAASLWEMRPKKEGRLYCVEGTKIPYFHIASADAKRVFVDSGLAPVLNNNGQILELSDLLKLRDEIFSQLPKLQELVDPRIEFMCSSFDHDTNEITAFYVLIDKPSGLYLLFRRSIESRYRWRSVLYYKQR